MADLCINKRRGVHTYFVPVSYVMIVIIPMTIFLVKSGRWLVGLDYNSKRGWLQSASVETGRVEILGHRWEYSRGTDWFDDDDTLKVQ